MRWGQMANEEQIRIIGVAPQGVERFEQIRHNKDRKSGSRKLEFTASRSSGVRRRRLRGLGRYFA